MPNSTPGCDASTELRIGILFDSKDIPRDTLNGDLDELCIFSGIRTEQDIIRLMNDAW